VPNPFEPIEDLASQIGDWVSDAPGVLSEIGRFAEDNWDTAVIGTVTVAVGTVTVVGLTACVVVSDGLGTAECIKGASVGVAATIGGVYATIESTEN
jgi:hypothetical protein